MPRALSSLKITWNPGGHVLLDFGSVSGDELADDIEFGVEQQTSSYSAIGQIFGSASADGGARRPISFSRRIFHADRAAALNYCHVYPALLPLATEGTLTVENQGGATFEYRDAVILSGTPRPSYPSGHATDTVYRLSAGNMVPTAGLPVAPGYPLEWYLTNCTDIDTPCGDL